MEPLSFWAVVNRPRRSAGKDGKENAHFTTPHCKTTSPVRYKAAGWASWRKGRMYPIDQPPLLGAGLVQLDRSAGREPNARGAMTRWPERRVGNTGLYMLWRLG